MSDNKKYYYLKLKDNYFDQDNIKILESMKNGHIYSLIILKLYIKSCKYHGKLMMTQEIPYNPDNIEILANVINHDIDHVKEAIKNGIKLGLITLLDSQEFWMTEIQNFIGHSSTEADRIRKYRKKLNSTNNVQMYNKSTPEIEIKREIEIEKEKEKNKDNKDKNICTESSSVQEKKKSIISFDCIKNNIYHIHEEDIIEWSDTYPAVDIIQELKRMKQWLLSNPAKKKTVKGMRRFITGWLDRKQDKGGNKTIKSNKIKKAIRDENGKLKYIWEDKC